MRRVIVLLLMLSSLSMVLHATPKTGYVDTGMKEDMFSIAFFSNESDDDCVYLTISSTSASEKYSAGFTIGSDTANEEMRSADTLYVCRELFSGKELLLFYNKEHSLEVSTGAAFYDVLATDMDFFDQSIPDSEIRKLSNVAAREIIREILEAHGVLILIEKYDTESENFNNIKLIDIPLDPAECREALRRLEAFERIP